MKPIRLLLSVLLLAAVFLGGYLSGSWSTDRRAAAGKDGRKILYYHDPMHPSYRSDKPGIAPDCGMKLEPVYADEGPDLPLREAKGKILYYRDPQDPDYRSDVPGLNPETGNDLEPVYENDASAMPVGTVQISPDKQQLIGVKFGVAELTGGTRQIRAAAKVAYDETRIAHVHTKIEGWIDRVFVDFTGKLVKKGEPLLSVYSPEMLAAQREFLIAARARDLMRDNPLKSAYAASESLMDAARQRMRLWDLSDGQIDKVLETGQPVKNVTLYSPIAGFVTERKAFPNQKVSPEDDLFTIADYSRVWIMADVYEYESRDIRVGQSARISLAYEPNRQFPAKVDYIQPELDPMTRTLKVRLEAANPGFFLKPEMFIDVTFTIQEPRRLSVPVEAVLDAGERKTVFVDRGNGYFEPRQVTVGERRGGRVSIISGLQAGERIVTSGNFLIDSESQLKAAAAGMGGMAGHQHGAGGMQKPKAQMPNSGPGAGEHAHD